MPQLFLRKWRLLISARLRTQTKPDFCECLARFAASHLAQRQRHRNPDLAKWRLLISGPVRTKKRAILTNCWPDLHQFERSNIIFDYICTYLQAPSSYLIIFEHICSNFKASCRYAILVRSSMA